MHPAPSVILFTVLSGAGFGLLVALGLGLVLPSGWAALWLWGLGYGLAVAGLMASAFHLGRPERAWRAFTQWRSSWLSREAWGAVIALLALAPVALSDWLGLGWPRMIGWIGAGLAVATVFSTAMIYAQLRAVPRWNHWITPATFLAFMATGGAILSGQGAWAALLCLALAGLLVIGWRIGDTRFAAAGSTMGTATGLLRGRVSVFEAPHTGDNYLTREMIHVVGRRHARKLRMMAVVCAGVVPALLMVVLPGIWGPLLAAPVHLIGAAAQRWLFFAEAEHVVGLFYGRR
ncbi:dibenzothiophene desulfurase [Aliigemmobacter aestuarii]|uniref:Dibenzothiophene desulfurase n=1 Tax=Aliigemmobacter aestuarii TaxID=1445661 RepID=A0A4V3V099_9RHOB|nr:DmsC/YnfH family molybdoenzyme membrane anchor subunit [Gemmobacter aestuarii]THD82940.1 dibenzothiophene desulfurase [Gemmobacter aestuarii]